MIMKIHSLTTGTVSVKHGFLFPRHGARRQLDLFLPGAFSEPLPIHCWAIEHDGVLRLVDTGDTAAARNVPFARMHVR
jgi:N-acyl homoserine lactone hydrolase